MIWYCVQLPLKATELWRQWVEFVLTFIDHGQTAFCFFFLSFFLPIVLFLSQEVNIKLPGRGNRPVRTTIKEHYPWKLKQVACLLGSNSGWWGEGPCFKIVAWWMHHDILISGVRDWKWMQLYWHAYSVSLSNIPCYYYNSDIYDYISDPGLG